MRKWLVLAVKAAITVGLLVFLLRRADLSKVVVKLHSLDVGDALQCFGLLAVQIALITYRWELIGRAIDVGLRFWQALRILTIGLFFNQTLPSSVGGDAVRMWLVARDGVPLSKAFSSVLCDRVLGLVALVVVIAASLPIMESEIAGARTLHMTLSALVAAVGVGLVAMVFFGEQLARPLNLWRWTRPFGGLISDFRRILVKPFYLVSTGVISIFTHLLSVAVFVVLSRGLGLAVGFVGCLLVIPTVMLITTLPISVAGWGVREGAMVAGFNLLGVGSEDALAISVLYGLVQIIISLPGGVLWLMDRPKRAADFMMTTSE